MTTIQNYLKTQPETQKDSGEAVGSRIQLRAEGTSTWRTAKESTDNTYKTTEGVVTRVVELGRNFQGDGFEDHTKWPAVRKFEIDRFALSRDTPYAREVKRLCADENRQHMTVASIYVLGPSRFVEFRLQTANLFFGNNKQSEPVVSKNGPGGTGDHSESIVYAVLIGVLQAYCNITFATPIPSGLREVYTRNVKLVPAQGPQESISRVKPSVFVTLINKQAPCEGCAKVWNSLVEFVQPKVKVLWGSCQYVDTSDSDVTHQVIVPGLDAH